MCYDYYFETYFGKLFTWSIAIIIVLTNSLTEKLFNKLTMYIGYKYRSE